MIPGGVRARLLTLLILLLVFGAGLAVGVAVDRQVAAAADAPNVAPVEERRSGEHGDDDDDEPRRRLPMIERVGLSDAQRLEVDSVFRSWGERMSSLQKEYRLHYWAVVDSTRAAMREVLNPEQAMAYDSLVVQNDRRRRPDSVSLPRN